MLFNLLKKSNLIIIIFIFCLFKYDNNFIMVLANNSDDLYSKWELQGDAYITDEGYLVLTEAQDWQKGRAWYKEDVIGTFNVSFRYKIGGGSGADGLIFAFDKSIEDLSDAGGNLGFGTGGYGVEFDTYINGEFNDPQRKHISFIKGRVSNHINSYFDDNLNDNDWHDVMLKVSPTSIEVILDDQIVIDYSGPIIQQHSNIGFMAATGIYNDWHMIDLNSFYVEVIDKDGGILVNPENGHTYLLANERVTFSEAEKICKNIGGYVATITSEQEQDFIYQNYLIDGILDSYYLGGTDEENEGEWKWITGETFTYSNWDYGEPNGWGMEGKEDHLTVYSNSGKWNDTNQSAKEGYICEFDSSEQDINLPVINNVLLSYNGNDIDLLRKNFNINENDSSIFELKVNIDWKNEELKEIILQQGSNKISLKKETFKLKLTDVFNPEEPIYIMAVSKNGINSVAKRLNLNINTLKEENSPQGELKLESITVGETPENTPIIGKTRLGINISKFRYSAIYDNVKDIWNLTIGYGTPLNPSNNWNKVKELYELNKIFEGNGGSFSLSSKMSFSSSALGYIEFKGDINSIDELLDGGLLVDISGSQTFVGSQYLVMAGPIPIPLYITAGGSLYGSLKGEISNLNTDKIELKGNAELTPKVVAEGGVGVNKIATVGAEGNIGLKMYGDLLDTKLNLKVAGGLSIVARIFAYQAKLDMLGFEYPSNKKNSEDFNLYSINNYSLMPRDYLNAQTEWGTSLISSLSEEDIYKNQDITILQQGIYPDSRPEIMMINDQKIMIWIRDNDERSSINRTELVFSIYDEINQKWSEPQAIYDDGTGDFYPQVAKDENDLYVVWQNINVPFTNDDITVDTLAKHSDIMISKFNSDKNTFDKPTWLTSDDYYDGLPMLSVKDGEIAVSWVRNSENDIFGQNHKNELMFKYYRNGKWEDTQVVAKEQSIINSLDIVNNGQEQYIIYSLDVDNNPSTIDDQELVLISMNNGKLIKTEQITTNSVIDSNPQFVNLDNSIGLFYYSDNQLVFTEDINKIKPNPVFKEGQGLGTDSYQILNDDSNLMILWSKDTEDSIEVFGVKYDEESKSFDNEMILTHVNQRIKAFDALFEDNGSILLVANIAEKIENQVENVIYYSDGISSLGVIKVNPLEDLTINQESLYIDESSYIVNQAIPITFEVTNKGQEISNGFKIELFDGVSLSPNYTATVNTILKTGESSIVEVQFNPEEAIQYSGMIKITPLGSQDAFEADNITTFTVGYSDPYIKDITSSTIDDKLSLNMVFSNTSNISSKNITVNIREDNEEGNILYSTIIKKLESDVDVRLDYELDTADLEFDEDRKKVLYVELVSENDEKYMYNNSEFIVVTNPYQKEDVNRDNKIDILDLSEVANNYNLQYDADEFDFKYDINGDGIIDLYDFVLISKEMK